MPRTRAAAATGLNRSFYARDPRSVAPELLNKLLQTRDGRSGRIVEVEAYAGSEDEAAHTHRGKTRRNASMFGEAGHLYVYRSYGIHWCANIVCGAVDEGVGVLLRALQPVSGLEAMRALRGPSRSDRQLCRGPGCLCQALGISGAHDGLDLLAPDAPIRLLDDGTPPPAAPGASARVGIARAADKPWRWYVPGNRYVSAYRK